MNGESPSLKLGAQIVMGESFEEALTLAQAAERAGFSRVLVPDHFYTGQGALTAGAVAEAWTTLAALAARTERVRLGGGVMCNLFRHPCLTAQTAATVDRISGGRVELGLGAGWLAEEFRRTGLPYPPARQRIRMLDEALAVILPALEGQRVDFSGEFYQVRDFEVRPAPLQSPRPRIHIGGGGDRLLGVAARRADIVSIIPPNRSGRIQADELARFDPARFEERIGFVRAQTEAAGRDPADLEVLEYCAVHRITASAAETERVLARLATALGADSASLRESPLVWIGTPEELADVMKARRERFGIAGAVIAGPARETLEILGKEVVPRLA